MINQRGVTLVFTAFIFRVVYDDVLSGYIR